jgi:iron complex outermembrane receptor protein
MAPGVQVARVDSNKWAISARGFNGHFANKLLVLIDERSVYTPLFGGVFWDVQDTMLEDIERIEVIRGPGASLWGSNAVNGVINIITKSAKNTQGGLLSVGAGNMEKGVGSLRYGGKLGDLGDYRVYTKYFNRGNNYISGTNSLTHDHWDQVRTGFRADLIPQPDDTLTVQGDFYHGLAADRIFINSPTSPWYWVSPSNQDVTGFNLQTRWKHTLSTTDSFNLQAYYDQTERQWEPLNERRRTADIDFQYRTQRFDRHDLLLGFAYRLSQDYTVGSFNIQFYPAKRGTQLFSAFIQDDFMLLKDTLMLTISSKLEHNDFSGFEGQPNARLLWTPNKQNTFWASVARAVRIPSRSAQQVIGIAGYFSPNDPRNPLAGIPNPPFNTNVLAMVYGSPDFDAESVLAYEAGYKSQINSRLSFDLALFFNQYTRLRSSTINPPTCQPGGQVVATNPFCLLNAQYTLLPIYWGNQGKVNTYGAELAVDWHLLPQWRLQGAYTFLNMIAQPLKASNTFIQDVNINPSQQMSLRSAWTPRSDIDIDIWLRYMDRIGGHFDLATATIPAYLQMDARIAWRPMPKLELSVAGFNLLDNQHPEFMSELNDMALTGISRSFYGQVRWEF